MALAMPKGATRDVGFSLAGAAAHLGWKPPESARL